MAPHRPYEKCKQCGKWCAHKSGYCVRCRPAVLQARFLEAYEREGTVGEAAVQCQVARAVIYRMLDEDSTFRARYEEAQILRRDRLVSLLYKAAKGDLGTSIETVVSSNKRVTREVEKQLAPAQVVAIMHFLRATDHLADTHDQLTFTEKRREELSAQLADERERREREEQARKPRQLPPGAYLDYSDQPPPDAPWLGGNPPPPPLHIIHPIKREDFEEPAPEPELPPKPAVPPGPVSGPVGPPYAASYEPPKPQLKRW